MGTGRMLRDKKLSTAGVLLATFVVFGILGTLYEFHGRSYHFVMAASPGLQWTRDTTALKMKTEGSRGNFLHDLC